MDAMCAFSSLLTTPGVREVCELRGTVGFMAYHGGSLEAMTDVIARTAAARAGASCYSVIQPDGMRQHFPSTGVSAAASDSLTEFFDRVEVVITIHGYGRHGMFTSLLLGGGNRALAEHVGTSLRGHLPEYEIVTDLDAIPRELRGLHPDNPVNVPPGGGVQIELPPRVRGAGPRWADWDGPGLTPHTESLITGLVDAATTWERTARNDTDG